MSLLTSIPWTDLVLSYGYFVLFAVILMESAGIPCPGETVLIAAAVFAGTGGGLDVGGVILVATTAAILGDNIGFWVGRRFGFPLLARYGPRLGLSEQRLKLAQYLFLKHGGKIVFFGRFTALLRAWAAVLAGANHYPPRRFLAYNAVGGVAWASSIGLGAFFVGSSIEHLLRPVGFALLAVLLGTGIMVWRFVRKHEARLIQKAEHTFPGPIRSPSAL